MCLTNDEKPKETATCIICGCHQAPPQTGLCESCDRGFHPMQTQLRLVLIAAGISTVIQTIPRCLR